MKCEKGKWGKSSNNRKTNIIMNRFYFSMWTVSGLSPRVLEESVTKKVQHIFRNIYHLSGPQTIICHQGGGSTKPRDFGQYVKKTQIAVIGT